MPTISSGINIALQAMLAHSQALEVTEHNVANASTPGYRLQSAVLTANVPSQFMGYEHGLGAGQRGGGEGGLEMRIDDVERITEEGHDVVVFHKVIIPFEISATANHGDTETLRKNNLKTPCLSVSVVYPLRPPGTSPKSDNVNFKSVYIIFLSHLGEERWGQNMLHSGNRRVLPALLQ